MKEPAFWSDLKTRGVLYQTTDENLGAWLAGQVAEGRTPHVYCGFDPTASSLHIGSLLPILTLRRLKAAGARPIALVGGATGMIGDPSGKSEERRLLDPDELERNVEGIRRQLERMIGGEAGVDFELVDNAEWFADVRYVDFLRDVGKFFSVNMMVAKESIRARLEDREHGISYTEFSYMLLQAYDFLHLFDAYGCRLQIGGSDQWGNITAGIDLIRRKHPGEAVYGFTFPLLTTRSGRKFGKSERGAVYLDARRTHPYFLYKYFFDVQDAEVVRYLNLFTFLPRDEIDALESAMVERPHLREGHRALAREVAALVHGEAAAQACEGLEAAMHADDSEAFERHAGRLGLLDPDWTSENADRADSPVLHLPIHSLDGAGVDILDLAVRSGLFESKSDARREIKSGGLKLAGRTVQDADYALTRDALGDRRVVPIRRGKRQKRMLVFYEQDSG